MSSYELIQTFLPGVCARVIRSYVSEGVEPVSDGSVLPAKGNPPCLIERVIVRPENSERARSLASDLATLRSCSQHNVSTPARDAAAAYPEAYNVVERVAVVGRRERLLDTVRLAVAPLGADDAVRAHAEVEAEEPPELARLAEVVALSRFIQVN